MRQVFLVLSIVALVLAAGAGARAQPMPQVIHPEGTGAQAVARRDTGGSYVVQAEVNGAGLAMLFDTGASVVALRAEDAARAGIDVGSLVYSGRTSTANGQAAVAPIIIRTLTVGPITRHNIPAIVSKPGQLAYNLLGQSFMARLSGYRLEGGQLVLQGQ